MVVVQEEQFVQAPLPAVDILFVVDGTASMHQELDALQASAADLLGTLDELDLDWHLGVVDGDAEGPFAGWLLGSPYVLTSAHPDPLGAFAERLPRDRESGEQGLAAATLALRGAGASGPNSGFLRPGAQLSVIIVSDADDASVDPEGPPLDSLLAEVETRAGVVSALVGDVPDGCTSANGSAQPGLRYAEAVEATGGRLDSICSATFSDALADLGAGSFALPDRFELRTPDAENVTVLVDGEPTQAFRVHGAVLVFDTPPPSGALIEVRYTVREEEEE